MMLDKRLIFPEGDRGAGEESWEVRQMIQQDGLGDCSWSKCIKPYQVRLCKLPPRGTEQGPNSSGKRGFTEGRDADSDALCVDSIPSNADLVELLQAWPTLSAEARASIMATVRGKAAE